jgi:hypothetical protein
MNDQMRDKFLRISLVAIGVTFIVGIWVLGQIWPSGWSWHTVGRSHYYEMILAVYATLGVFLLLASRDPSRHLSLIWFTVWSSVAHATVMAYQSFDPGDHLGHLWGDVAALYIVAAWLAFLMPRKPSA